jgi:L-threonylcarbamoyladenylate synthase
MQTETKTASPIIITAAQKLLESGVVVALPTETVYGLAADATSDKAVAGIYALKERPQFNPLIIHVANIDQAKKLAVFTPLAEKLAATFWPGPLTIILRRRDGSGISKLAVAGLETIALRVPAHPVMRAILEKLPFPLAAPSANKSGRLSATSAAHVLRDFNWEIPLIVDGGASAVGLESTIIDLSAEKPALLRAGGLAREEIENITGALAIDIHSEKPKSPGQLLKHYAPRIKLRIGTENPKKDEALLAFGPNAPDGFAKTLNLSMHGNLVEAAANLFAYLHELDQPQYSGIAVQAVPRDGLGFAIMDRLERAAKGSGQ